MPCWLMTSKAKFDMEEQKEVETYQLLLLQLWLLSAYGIYETHYYTFHLWST